MKRPVFSAFALAAFICLPAGAQFRAAPAPPAGAAKGGARPGKFLKGKTFHLKPGQTFAFRAWENQIQGIASIKAEGAETGSREIKSRRLRSLGGKTLFEHTISVPAGAPSGSEFEVEVSGAYQSLDDPNWTFRFKLLVD